MSNLNKIFIFLVVSLFLLSIITLRNTEMDKQVLRTNLEIEDITSLNTSSVYLLNKDKYLVKTEISLIENKLLDQVEEVINYLKIDNYKIPESLEGYLPPKLKILDKNIEDKKLILNFSSELLKIDLDKYIPGIVYSLLELERVEKIIIKVDNKPLNNYDYELDENTPINKVNTIKDYNLTKVILYYLSEDNYYVPVTKYINKEDNKIKVIIDELKTPTNNLISMIDDRLKLISYKEENNILFLNFNKYLSNNNSNVNDKVYNTIAYSTLANYDVNMISFEEDDKIIKYIMRE